MSAAATPAGGAPTPLNGKAVAAVFESIIEQPAYTTTAGGLACTDRDSYAQARALLILTALALFPLLRKRFPELRVASMRESHPQDAMNLASGKAMWIRAADPADPSRIHIHVPCRSKTSLKVLDAGEVRRSVLAAVALWRVPTHGREMADLASALEREFLETYTGKVPTDLHHLVRMRVVPEKYIWAYNEAVGLPTTPAADADDAAGTTGGSGSSSRSLLPVSPDAAATIATLASAPRSLLPRVGGDGVADEPLALAPGGACSGGGGGGGGGLSPADEAAIVAALSEDVDAATAMAIVSDAGGAAAAAGGGGGRVGGGGGASPRTAAATAAAAAGSSPTAARAGAAAAVAGTAYAAKSPPPHGRKGSELWSVKGSAVHMWWPPREESITFAAAQAIVAEAKERAALIALVEKDEVRRRMAEAARARLAASTPG